MTKTGGVYVVFVSRQIYLHDVYYICTAIRKMLLYPYQEGFLVYEINGEIP